MHAHDHLRRFDLFEVKSVNVRNISIGIAESVGDRFKIGVTV